MMKNKVTQYRRFEKRVIKGRSTCGDVKTLQVSDELCVIQTYIDVVDGVEI